MCGPNCPEAVGYITSADDDVTHSDRCHDRVEGEALNVGPWKVFVLGSSDIFVMRRHAAAPAGKFELDEPRTPTVAEADSQHSAFLFLRSISRWQSGCASIRIPVQFR